MQNKYTSSYRAIESIFRALFLLACHFVTMVSMPAAQGKKFNKSSLEIGRMSFAVDANTETLQFSWCFQVNHICISIFLSKLELFTWMRRLS